MVIGPGNGTRGSHSGLVVSPGGLIAPAGSDFPILVGVGPRDDSPEDSVDSRPEILEVALNLRREVLLPDAKEDAFMPTRYPRGGADKRPASRGEPDFRGPGRRPCRL